MEFEKIIQTENVIPILPKWAKVLLRFYAVIILGVVTTSFIRLFFLILEKFGDMVTDTISMLIAMLFLVVMIISTIVIAVYGYNLFRLRRWTMVPSCLTAFNACLYLYIYTTLPSIHPVIGVIVVSFNILSISIAFISVRFRNSLFGGSRIVGIIFSTLFILLSLPYLLYGLASIVVQDYKTVNDSDLILEPIQLLSQADNAHYYLPNTDEFDDIEAEQYQSALDIAGRVSYEELSIDQAVIAVHETKTYTDAFITASKQKGYQCPTSVNKHSFDTVLCSLNDIRNLATLTALRAKVALSKGDIEDATESSLAIVRLAHQMEESHQKLIEYLVAIALYRMGAESLDEISNFYSDQDSSMTPLSRNTSSTLKNIPNTILVTIRDYSPDHTKLATGYRAEYMLNKTIFTDPSILKNEYGIEVKESYLWQPHRTIDSMADLARKQVSYANLGCDAGEELVEKIDHETQLLLLISPMDFVKPNIFGRVVLNIVDASVTGAREKACAIEQQYKELETDFENLVSDRGLY